MKWLMIALLVVPVVTVCSACPKNASEWNGGCVYDLEPNTAPPVVPSDEKPSGHPQPAYQRGEVTIVDAPNCAKEDERMDQEKIEATKQGRKAAGIR